MRKFKSVIALLLAVSMMLCFAACGKDVPDEEKIKGKWTTELDFTGYMNSIHSESDLNESVIPDTEMNAYMVFEFEEQRCSMYFDREKTLESINAYLDDFKGKLIDYLYKQYESTGLSKEEIDSQFKGIYDVTIEEFADMIIWSTMDAEAIADSIAEEGTAVGYYKLEEGKIYIADSLLTMDKAQYYSYSFNGDKLLIEGAGSETFFSSFEEIGIEFPFVFEKK